MNPDRPGVTEPPLWPSPSENSMKSLPLLLVACFLATPVLANEERCMDNLQKLDSGTSSPSSQGGAATANPMAHSSATEARMFVEQAREAQARGDTDGCVAASERALKAIDDSYRHGNGSGSGSGGPGSGGAGSGGAD
jgi:hypothetical protein